MFYRSRYRSEPDIVDIQEEEFSDRVWLHCLLLDAFEWVAIETECLHDSCTSAQRVEKNLKLCSKQYKHKLCKQKGTLAMLVLFSGGTMGGLGAIVSRQRMSYLSRL